MGGTKWAEAGKFEVLRIQKVRNGRLEKCYISKLEDLSSSMPVGAAMPPMLASHKTDLPGCNANECLLFHGASSAAVNKICKTGFDPRYSGANGTLFGQAS